MAAIQGLTRLRATVLAIVVGLAGLLALSAMTGSAIAGETHTIKVDNGRLTMGYVFMNNKIMPADVPGPLDPNRPNDSADGTIEVEIDGNSARVAEAGFRMPIVWIPDPTAGGAPIPMNFGPVGDLTGTWNAQTGELSLAGTLQVDVIWGYNDEGPQICRFTAPDVTWTTAANAISPGVPFNSPEGLEGKGALSAFWGQLPNGESINGGSCSKPNMVVRDPGAVWLSNGIETVPAAPTCLEQGKEGLWPDCVEPEPWPEPEPELKVNITRVQVGKGKIKAGSKTRIVIKVTNRGDKDATGLRVNLKSTNKAVKAPKQIRLRVPAGKTATARVNLAATRKAKGRAVITARVAGKTGKGVVTVQKVKKKKK